MASSPLRAFARKFAVSMLIAVACFGTAAAGEPHAFRSLVKPGERAAKFTLTDLKGKRVAYRPGGKSPSLVVFWSAFCPLCRELIPSLNGIAGRYEGSVRIVGVNLDGKRFSHAVQSFVRETGISYPVLYDDLKGDYFIASDPYGVEKTPTAVLVDAAGTVRGTYVAEEMRGMIRDFDGIVGGLIKGARVGK